MGVEAKSAVTGWTVASARAAVVEGRVSAAALAEEHFERIAAVDPEIHSFLALTRERAMAQAEKVDAAVKAGDPVGALAGVPVGIKDVLATKGVVTTAGSKILDGYRPPYDATVVARLEDAGAVMLGKLNCDEVVERELGLWAGEESAGAGSSAGRELGRVGCGGGCGVVRGEFGNGYGRVDSAAGGVLRGGGRAAYVWASKPVWVDCVCFVAGSGGTVCADGGGCGGDDGGAGGSGCDGRYVFAGSCGRV
jgi:hypothetical protein